jgi:kumamolisin
MKTKTHTMEFATIGLLALATSTTALAVENQCGPAFQSRLQESASESWTSDKASGLFHSMVGHIPKAVKKMADQGKLNEEQVVPVTFALQLNNEDQLDRQIEEMYRAGSPTYHQFITPKDFLAHYAPTAAQVQKEKDFLESKGISVQDVSANNVLINATGTVAALNAAFKTEIHQFVRAKDGKAFYAPAQELQAPVNSRIAAVIGMSNTAEMHPFYKMRKDDALDKKASHPKEEGNAPGAYGGLTPADIRTAYHIPANLDGSGQTLALFELDGYKAANITAYEKQFNLPATPLTNVLVGGFNGKPTTGEASGEVEVELDIELMVGLAPKAKQILVYEGAVDVTTNDPVVLGQAFINVYSKIASDNLANIISSSWGFAEDQHAAASMQAENTIFKQMVAQGQTFFTASGDSGAEQDGSTISINDPASQPYVVAVGGTKMLIDSSGNWKSETTWNEIPVQEGAGGGGVSTVWTIPSYQVGVSTADTQFSTTKRNMPDVSLNSDPETGYGVYATAFVPSSQANPSVGTMKTVWSPVGGTSAATPLWAAYNALVNQNRAAKNLSPTGFMNPLLYAIGKSSKGATDFHDIADKSNNGDAAGSFTAYAGYDNATGWGSFEGTNLLNDLSTDTPPAHR